MEVVLFDLISFDLGSSYIAPANGIIWFCIEHIRHVKSRSHRLFNFSGSFLLAMS